MTASQSQSSVTGVGQIAIVVHDLPRAVSFYRDTLGLPFLFETGGMAFLRCGPVRIMLTGPEEPEHDHAASIIYYRVDDIHAAHSRIAAAGAEFVRDPHLIAKLPDHDLWMAFLRDSEGNLLALMSEVHNG